MLYNIKLEASRAGDLAGDGPCGLGVVERRNNFVQDRMPRHQPSKAELLERGKFRASPAVEL